MTLWRIGKLNFAFYEKLHNTVMDLLPRNWVDLGHDPTVLQAEVVLQRMHNEAQFGGMGGWCWAPFVGRLTGRP